MKDTGKQVIVVGERYGKTHRLAKHLESIGLPITVMDREKEINQLKSRIKSLEARLYFYEGSE